MTKDCMLLRYQIYILTSCEFVDDLQMGVVKSSNKFSKLPEAIPYPNIYAAYFFNLQSRENGIES